MTYPILGLIEGRNLFHLAGQLRRCYGTDAKNTASLLFARHCFSQKQASERFSLIDRQHTLGPIHVPTSKALTLRTKDPLERCQLPFFAGQAEATAIRYNGQYGKERQETYYTVNPQGKVVLKTETYIDWYDFVGTLRPRYYPFERPGMQVYAGFEIAQHVAEHAIARIPFVQRLEPFDRAVASAHNTRIDPFEKREAMAVDTMRDRIYADLRQAAANDIERQTGSMHTHVNVVHYQLSNLEVLACMLPMYTLSSQVGPPRVMQAITEELRIEGSREYSMTKVGLITALASGAFSLAFPWTIPLRVAAVAAGAFLGAAGTKLAPIMQKSHQERTLYQQRESNQHVRATDADRRRYNATASVEGDSGGTQVFAEDKYYEILGLVPGQLLTEELIRQAYKEQIRLFHPDLTGSHERAAQINIARDVLLKLIRQQ